jgi:hypothetical protein
MHRPRDFTYAYKKTHYVPTTAPDSGAPNPATEPGPSQASGGPSAKHPRIGGADTTPTAGRICSTPVVIYNYRFSHHEHKVSLGFMYGI